MFRFHYDGVGAIDRLTRHWTDNTGLRPVNPFQGKILTESWSPSRIGRTLDQMAGTSFRNGAPNNMRTDKKPRFTAFPLIVVRTQGKEFIIDGRRRSNIWRYQEGEFPVHVIEIVA